MFRIPSDRSLRKKTIVSIKRVILWAKVRKISINRPGKKSKGINQKWCGWPPHNICIENYIWLHFTGFKIIIAIKYTACTIVNFSTITFPQTRRLTQLLVCGKIIHQKWFTGCAQLWQSGAWWCLLPCHRSHLAKSQFGLVNNVRWETFYNVSELPPPLLSPLIITDEGGMVSVNSGHPTKANCTKH